MIIQNTTTLDSDAAADMETKIQLLLASFLHNPALLDTFHIPRFKLRLEMIREWGVREGERLLDIGCGQGESLLALATVVGDRGHVTGIDTASMDYGHPFTMRESHAHIRKSALAPRISFYPVDAASFLAQRGQASDAPAIDAVVLCQSLFYFPSEGDVHSLFNTLSKAKLSRIYVSEWCYTPSNENQIPHILAVRAQALFYRYKMPCEPGPREQNVRAGVDQQTILQAAKLAGYRVSKESLMTPEDDMLEGQFEVRSVLDKKFRQKIIDEHLRSDQEEEICATIRQLESELEKRRSDGSKFVRAMDVWCAVLELDQ